MKQKRTKKWLIALLIVLFGFAVWTQTYSYNVDDAVEYLNENGMSRSHHCCAWYVMRAMQSGGCPMVILPAWAYRYVLPCYGFKVVAEGYGNEMAAGYDRTKGDIVVIENGSHSFWGHIALYTGHRWISDFKQRTMSPYRSSPKYRIYRKND